mmetsp:Transcript_20411/g.28706  ORF Transcript_20411/g.28706 Transcript_20411/m.28706 type:complete len:229 (+) Transcript_20411:80-766(+)
MMKLTITITTTTTTITTTATTIPLQTHDNSFQQQPHNRGFMVVSFSRSSLGQTGEGHFSPIAAYHEPSDSCLVLDVARFKYAPYWVSVTELYDATRPVDSVTALSRGWFNMYPPNPSHNNNNNSNDNNSNNQHTNNKNNNNIDTVGKYQGYGGVKAIDERIRPANIVPLTKSGLRGSIDSMPSTGVAKNGILKNRIDTSDICENHGTCPVEQIKKDYCPVKSPQVPAK